MQEKSQYSAARVPCQGHVALGDGAYAPPLTGKHAAASKAAVQSTAISAIAVIDKLFLWNSMNIRNSQFRTIV
jgi:hypothetical protein